MTDSDAARLVESSEAHAYAKLITGAPPGLRRAYGLDAREVGSSHALVAAHVCDSLILNRVIGLGVFESVDERTLESLDALYRSNGVPTYALEISPVAQPAELPTLLRTWGFLPFKQTAMLYRRAEPIPRPACDLTVIRAGRAHASALAQLCCSVFGFEQPFPALLEATFDDVGWQHWLAVDGDQPVAAAITHTHGEVAWIGWVGTRPDYRGRGAQGAMTAAQLEGAAGGGCRWVTLETTTGTRNRPGQSLRNYVRFGWTVAYNRIVYVRRFELDTHGSSRATTG